MTDGEMNSQRNVATMQFLEFMKKHNVWIIKENFNGAMKELPRFKGEIEYVIK
jgi:hypothetical protein